MHSHWRAFLVVYLVNPKSEKRFVYVLFVDATHTSNQHHLKFHLFVSLPLKIGHVEFALLFCLI